MLPSLSFGGFRLFIALGRGLLLVASLRKFRRGSG
jgi:hypothetical protein